MGVFFFILFIIYFIIVFIIYYVSLSIYICIYRDGPAAPGSPALGGDAGCSPLSCCRRPVFKEIVWNGLAVKAEVYSDVNNHFDENTTDFECVSIMVCQLLGRKWRRCCGGPFVSVASCSGDDGPRACVGHFHT